MDHENLHPEQICIRAELPGDSSAIRAINIAAFPTPVEAQLVDALREHGHLFISLVAVVADALVGHIAFNPLRGPRAEKLGVGLAPMAVLPTLQRLGIGSALVRAGIEQCRTMGVGYIAVLGDPHYYSRFGFTAAAQWHLQDEYNGGAAFQAIELQPGSIPSEGGLVRYAEEFSMFT